MENEFPSKRSKTLSIKFDDFSSITNFDNSSSLTKTKGFYNYSISSGFLKVGHGFCQLALPLTDETAEEQTFELKANQVLGAWPFVWYDSLSKKDKYYVFYLDENKKMFFFNIMSDKMMYETMAQFNEIPNAVHFSINDGSDTMFFSSSADKTVGLNGSGCQVYDQLPQFRSGCWFGPYLFLITTGSNNKLLYSDKTFDLWMETQIKQVPLPSLRGGLTKLVSVGENLYLFREYGITVLSLYSTQSEVASSNIYDSSSYIEPSSIASNGEKIIFLAKDGLFSLEGKNVSKLDIPFFDLIDFASSSFFQGICFDGKYFLACKLKFDDETSSQKNNALLIYDLNNKTIEVLRGFDIQSMMTIKTPSVKKLCATFRGENQNKIGQLCEDGTFFGAPLEKMWISPKSDLGYAKNLKKITQIVAKPQMQCEIEIFSDLDYAKLSITPSNKTIPIKVNVVGRVFQVKISSKDAKSYVPDFELTAKVFL